MKKFIGSIFGSKKKSIEDGIPLYIGKIVKWLNENAPALSNHLNPPATEHAIKTVESNLNITFHSQVREAYLIHDGERSDSDGLFGLWRWLSLSEMEKEFHILNEHKDSDAIRIPILRSPGGDIYYEESGGNGEIIDWWHARPSRDVKYDGFKSYLLWFTDRLLAGQYVYRPNELSGLIDKSEM